MNSNQQRRFNHAKNIYRFLRPDHIITPETEAELEKIARSLPPIVKYDKYGNPEPGESENKLGADLIKAGIKEMHGNTVVPDQLYTMRKAVYENHLRNLKRQYKNRGNKAVENYVKVVRTIAFETLPFKIKVVAVWRTVLTHLGILKRKTPLASRVSK